MTGKGLCIVIPKHLHVHIIRIYTCSLEQYVSAYALTYIKKNVQFVAQPYKKIKNVPV